MEGATSLSEAHEFCTKSFLNLLSAIILPARDFGNQMTPSDVQAQFDKYGEWAARVGAARSGHEGEISLDYRLSEAPFYKTQVCWQCFLSISQ